MTPDSLFAAHQFLTSFKKEIAPFIESLAEQALADAQTPVDEVKFFSGKLRGAKEVISRLEEFYDTIKETQWSEYGDTDV